MFRAPSTQGRQARATTARKRCRWRRPRQPKRPDSDEDHHPPMPLPLLHPDRSSIWRRVPKSRPGLHIGAVDHRATTAHRLQPFPEFFGDCAGIHAVSNKPRLDEDDDLGSCFGVVRISEQIAEELDFSNARYARLRLLVTLADKSSKQDGLTADDG